MKIYEVTWQEEKSVRISARDEEEAIDKVKSGEYMLMKEDTTDYHSWNAELED